MMRWLVTDSLYCPEAFFCSHLSSYSHYLREAGEDVASLCLGPSAWRSGFVDDPDVSFILDQYDRVAEHGGRINIAQVAAVCSPMPWDVRRPDGSPAYDLVISSIPWMVEAARAAGCRAEYQALAFDHRALSCSMGVERDIDCLFVGTVDANHQKRARVLKELEGLVTIEPPTFGAAYYRLLARAKVLIQVGAEWAGGSANALRLFEGGALSGAVVSDGRWDGPGRTWWQSSNPYGEGEDWRAAWSEADGARSQQGLVLTEHGYHRRIPQLISWARSL